MESIRRMEIGFRMLVALKTPSMPEKLIVPARILVKVNTVRTALTSGRAKIASPCLTRLVASRKRKSYLICLVPHIFKEKEQEKEGGAMKKEMKIKKDIRTYWQIRSLQWCRGDDDEIVGESSVFRLAGSNYEMLIRAL